MLVLHRHLVSVVALAVLAGYGLVYAWPFAPEVIRSDGLSYYVYLPSTFLYGDPTLEALARDYFGGAYPPWTAIERWPATGRWVNTHPIGVAVLQAPFFAFAHALTRWSHFPPDGFSIYYQHAVGLAGAFYIVAGLALLKRELDRHFSPGVVVATIVCLTWGTNLFHYATFDSSYSHGYSFFLICSLLVLTPRWRAAPSAGTSILVGLVVGTMVLVRHTNVVYGTIFVWCGIAGSGGCRGWWTEARQRAWPLAAVGLTAALVVAPQLLLYQAVTGHLVVSAYGETRTFNFGSPRLFGVLMGPQKGLFFWSPLLLLAVAGFAVLPASLRRLRLPALCALGVVVYLTASWFDWQFGGSYGHRAFTDALGVFGVGLAATFAWAARRRVRAGLVGTAAAAFTALSVVQMAQYWLRIIPFSDTSWDLYRSVFLKLTP